jgi:hypothetical protein
MALLTVHDTGKSYVYNANFTTVSSIVMELKLPVGSVCTVRHCEQDHLPDERYIVEADGYPVYAAGTPAYCLS